MQLNITVFQTRKVPFIVYKIWMLVCMRNYQVHYARVFALLYLFNLLYLFCLILSFSEIYIFLLCHKNLAVAPLSAPYLMHTEGQFMNNFKINKLLTT